MIIETSSNQLYEVKDPIDPNLRHVWLGVPVKRERYAEGDAIKVRFVPKARASVRLIRKEACRVVQP
jgi:hypothetical protein